MTSNITNPQKLSARLMVALALCAFIVAGGLTSAQAQQTITPDTAWYYGAIANDPAETNFTVSTAEELAGLAKIVNDGADDFAGKTITLGADIVFNSQQIAHWDKWDESFGDLLYSWTPIGTLIPDRPFRGTFDGNKKTVSGIFISNNTMLHTGLFGYVNGATIKDVGVYSSFIRGDGYVGGIVGEMNYAATLSGSYFSGKVRGNVQVGGLAGTAFNSTVTDCYSAGSVSVNPGSTQWAGGLIGNVNVADVTNCYSIAIVTGGNRIGGLVGTVGGNGFAGGAYSIVRSVALNPTLEQIHSNNVSGRIIGSSNSSKTHTDNWAFVGIVRIDQGSNSYLWTDRTAEGVDGTDLRLNSIKSVSYWRDTVQLGANWTVAADKLPGLFGQTVDIPEHLETLPTYWSATGWYNDSTHADTFRLSTVDELKGLAMLVNAGINFHGQTIILQNDIVMNADHRNDWERWGESGYNVQLETWTPIGGFSSSSTNVGSFRGTFDGNEKTISGVYVDIEGMAGVFGSVGAGGTICNLGVHSSYIHSSWNTSGGIAASVNGGTGTADSATISSCYFNGKVRTNNSNNTSSHGGLAGSVSNGKVLNCYTNGSVISARAYVGGLVGSLSSGRVTNCYSTALVASRNSGTIFDNAVGGLIGGNGTGTIARSVALNSSLSLAAYSGADGVGRVSGIERGLNSNYGYDGMEISASSYYYDETNIGLTTKNGEDVSIETIKTTEFWTHPTSVFFNALDDVWTIKPDSLPGLFGKAVPLPKHLGGIEKFTVSITAGEGGKIRVDTGASVSSYDELIDEDTELTVTAVPDADYRFAMWSDNDTSAVRTITVTSAITLSANFVEVPEVVTSTSFLLDDLEHGGNIPYAGAYWYQFVGDDAGIMEYESRFKTNPDPQRFITNVKGIDEWGGFKFEPDTTEKQSGKASAAIKFRDLNYANEIYGNTIGENLYPCVGMGIAMTNSRDTGIGSEFSKVKAISFYMKAVDVDTVKFILQTIENSPNHPEYGGGVRPDPSDRTWRQNPNPHNAYMKWIRPTNNGWNKYTIHIDKITPSSIAGQQMYYPDTSDGRVGDLTQDKYWGAAFTFDHANVTNIVWEVMRDKNKFTSSGAIYVDSIVLIGDNIDLTGGKGDNITGSFRDTAFLAAVRQILGKGSTDFIYRSEVDTITSLDVSSKGITSLAGIEHFVGLTSLDCSKNKLTYLDVSKLINLTYLDCGNFNIQTDTKLTELVGIERLTKLTRLECGNNALTTLDVSALTELTILYCGDNLLTSLDVSALTNLTYLACHNNLLTYLDVAALTKLQHLACFNNQLTSLDISALENLTVIQLEDQTIDITLTYDDTARAYTAPITLNAPVFTDTAITYNDAIGILKSVDHTVTSTNFTVQTGNPAYPLAGTINISYDGGPTDITASFTDTVFRAAVYGVIGKAPGQPIYDIDVESITVLEVNSRGISSLAGIEHFVGLSSLYCNDNHLTSLDVSTLTDLWDFSCVDNKLDTLNVSGLAKLVSLQCQNNNLTSLDLSGAMSLVTLYCSGNKLTELDISGLTNLIFFDGHSQTIDLTLTYVDTASAYILPIALNDPSFDKMEISYGNGVLRSVDSIVASTSFTVQVGGGSYMLYGTMNFTYEGAPYVVPQYPVLITAGDGGIIRIGDLLYPYYEELVDSGTVLTVVAEVTDPNYVFVTWTDGDMTPYRTITVMNTIEINAIFTKVDDPYSIYVINFDSRGGGPVGGITVLDDGAQYVLPIPSRDGYIFDGWYKDLSYSGAGMWVYTDVVTSNITLYAKWVQKDESAPTVWPCGIGPADKVEAVYDKNNNRLIIKGNGMMANYDESGNLPPWKETNLSLSSVVIEYGVTSIGTNAFSGLPIGSVVISGTIGHIGDGAFDGCYNLSEIYVVASKPPYVFDRTFTYQQKYGSKVYVPRNSIDDYRKAAGWEFRSLDILWDLPQTSGGGGYSTPSLPVTDPKAVVVPDGAEASRQVSVGVTAGPNPATAGDGAVRIFIGADVLDRPSPGTGNISGTLTIYNATGNAVRKINVGALRATPTGNAIAEWDMRDSKGRMVPPGTYLVKGSITVDGKRKKISLKVGVK